MGKNKNILFISLVILLLYLFGCSPSPEKAFKNAKRQNTVYAYQQFIKKYPESTLVKDALKAIEKIEYEEAVEQNSVTLYENFINKYPDSELTPDIKNKLMELYWTVAKNRNRAEEYVNFYHKFPGSPHNEEILKILDERIYRFKPNIKLMSAPSSYLEIRESLVKNIPSISMKSLGKNSLVATVKDLKTGKMIFMPDVPGAKELHIKVSEDVGYTTVAGLQFEQDCVINIWNDGTIEVDREGVQATSLNNKRWISLKIPVKDKNEYIVMLAYD
ncbi:MAG: hypothetical protein AB1410_00275 [Acidobacteriota bacterium]